MPLTVYEKKIIEFGSEVVFMKAYRRELQSWSYYLLEPLLKEIARRLHLSLNQARMLLPEEITKALTSGRTDNELINRRLQYVVYGYAPQRLCITGEPGRNFIKNNIKPEKKAQLVDEFKGDIACAGKAKGTVKIINTPEDMKKMERGNILVSASTNPNLMPAIRQSAAIITDEGGLTCHAAIVSRELKIPCVVGTKIATQVLKDGDTVEVDANKGIVRKI
ncbi:hypothetical protein COU01_00050 [Candidatus Falkowbacteria bacterium CG10_big_fil_rev_8_21_14_0_10_44_15]|uniref:PEP-utilising enzyme mobile domain-containing protein n=1 Tax=Candidatus Falkowbacteria bacterium CG10_big_fil_rev_8_21_14_0_10_44_15 TaxID=1974569 RepID=A0A2H0V2W0_9BACT|nr:MAG: hypothetical protein COU01_00050 [Candidatus Falkowbacteria bacterium CG10_big_fil_rev_8_21_14_0_10_44_15]